LLILTAALVWPQASSAQIQNPLQAAKDAFNRALQQAGQPAQASQPPQQVRQTAQARPGAPAASGWGDCCSADFMKRKAAQAAVLDVVGVKLGMTPNQAAAAIRAHNPALVIDTIHVRIEHPTSNPAIPAHVDSVPLYIWAHTRSTNTAQGEVETISIRFTTPPSVPMAAEITRYVGFHNGEPVLASTLLDSVHKKYGVENAEVNGDNWIMDATSGKSLARPGPATNCSPLGEGPIMPLDGTTSVQTFNLLNTADNIGDPHQTLDCMGHIYVRTPELTNQTAPNAQIHSLTTIIMSGDLLAGSMRETHQSLLAESQDDAGKRAAPTL
jgi:hypothetical protein